MKNSSSLSIKNGSPHKMVYLVGAGPGDPELITIKAIKAIQESDVVLYDKLINSEILNYARKDALKIFVGKSKGCHSLTQEEICELLVYYADRFPVVSRLKGGDPFIFGRGGEEYDYLKMRGFECKVIPGVTAAFGAAASLNLPLTHRDHASEVVFLTAHRKVGDGYTSLKNRDFENKTYIIYMGLTRLQDICNEILETDPKLFQLPIAIIEKASFPEQRHIVGNIGNICDKLEEANLESPCLIIIGDVVSRLPVEHSNIFELLYIKH